MKSSLITKHELDSDILRQGRIDLAAALRWAARSGLNEGVCNHFSLELASDRYLINPQGLHWNEVNARDILLIDGQGNVLDGQHSLEPTAFFIHSWIHRLNPHARAVLHTHMPYATAITLIEDGRLAWCNQNTLRFWDRVGYDDSYNGLALEDAEGERIGFEIKLSDAPRVTKGFWNACADLQLSRAYVVAPVISSWPLSDTVQVIPLAKLPAVFGL